MTTYRVPRPKDLDLLFDGELLADVSSRDATDQERWTEIRIYRTESSKYVLEQIGRTTVEGEVDRLSVQVLTDPAAMPRILRRRRADGTWFFTQLVLEAFDQAAAKEPALAAAFAEKI